MKLKDIIQINKRCKLCDSKTVLYIRKYLDYIGDENKGFKSISKLGVKRKCSLLNNETITIEERGPFKYLISEAIIDIEKETFAIKAIEGYNQPRITLSLKFLCPIQMDYDHSDGDIAIARYAKKTDEDDFDTEEDYNFNNPYDASHYSSVYYVHIDQEKQHIENMFQITEKLEDDSFIVKKNFVNKTTNITKKEKSLQLSFILNKKFNDEEFTKLVEAAGLLK